MSEQTHRPLQVGDEFTVEVLRIAHGGHCVAHHDGRTIFVRHSLPGELVRVRVTGVTRKIVRADAIEILRPHASRVPAPCHWSGAAGCGGCDFQHVELGAQRLLKTDVLRTSLERFGGLDPDAQVLADLEVEELPGHPDGLRWMSRVNWASDDRGGVGLRKHRSHDVVPIDHCLLAPTGIDHPQASIPASTSHHVKHRTWTMQRGLFWQVHPALPEVLVDTVLKFGRPRSAEHWWDLYSGSGLLAAFLGEAVGPTGRIDAVESDRGAVSVARLALSDLPQVSTHQADVRRWLAAQHPDGLNGIVLDPPRSGAGAELIQTLIAGRPSRIVYVACDPVALARDVQSASDAGYELTRLRALDAFPMTHHFETVALLEPLAS